MKIVEESENFKISWNPKWVTIQSKVNGKWVNEIPWYPIPDAIMKEFEEVNTRLHERVKLLEK